MVFLTEDIWLIYVTDLQYGTDLFKYCKEKYIYFCFGIDLKTFKITFWKFLSRAGS